MIRRNLVWLTSQLLILGTLAAVNADITVYNINENGGLAGFNAAAGNPPVNIDFDSIAHNTDVGGSTIAGITFNAPRSGAPLIVVGGNATFTPGGFSGVIDPATNKLFSVSHANVLSPGGLELGPGPNIPIENDDLELVFQQSVSAFGFDHLSQSADGNSFSSIQVFNQSDSLIFSGSIPISDLGGAGAPGSADFWGATTSNGDLIGRIVIDERDANDQFPDSNIGFDSFRFNAIPEPSEIALIATISFLALGNRRTLHTPTSS